MFERTLENPYPKVMASKLDDSIIAVLVSQPIYSTSVIAIFRGNKSPQNSKKNDTWKPHHY